MFRKEINILVVIEYGVLIIRLRQYVSALAVRHCDLKEGC
jgi:hypothetical protein